MCVNKKHSFIWSPLWTHMLVHLSVIMPMGHTHIIHANTPRTHTYIHIHMHCTLQRQTQSSDTRAGVTALAPPHT